MKKEIDLHGYRVDDVRQKVDSIVGQARIFKLEEECAFITGTGVIQEEVRKILSEYDLDYHTPSHNLGIIYTTVK